MKTEHMIENNLLQSICHANVAMQLQHQESNCWSKARNQPIIIEPAERKAGWTKLVQKPQENWSQAVIGGEHGK